MELRHYIRMGLKWWWLILLAILIAASTSYLVSKSQTPVYRASTVLIVGQAIQSIELNSNDILTSERLALTYANIAQRQPVLQAVIDALNLSDTVQQLKKRVDVRPINSTQLLEISVEANSPEEARLTADEVARQLISQSPTAMQEQEAHESRQIVRQRLEGLQSKIETGQKRLEELEAEMTGSLSAERVQELQAEIINLENLIAGWEDNFTQLLVFSESERSANYLAVVEPAQANPNPVRPRTLVNTLLGGIVGFLLALGVIFLLEYLDDTFKSIDDFSQALGLTALGTVDRINGKYYSDKLISTQGPFSPTAESYRMIRSNIQFASVDRPAKSLLITSAVPEEGKSTTVANLGIVMAQAGLKTIIIDADLRRPTQHQIFQMPNLGGLTELLRLPEPEIGNQLKETHIENLYVIPSGILPPNPAELLASQRMGQLLTRLNELVDNIIIDCPPVLAVTDAVVLSNRVDGVILVTKAGQTRCDTASQAVFNLKQAKANLLGGVLNGLSNKKESYYKTYYSPSNLKEVMPTNHATQVKPQRQKQGLPFFR